MLEQKNRLKQARSLMLLTDEIAYKRAICILSRKPYISGFNETFMVTYQKAAPFYPTKTHPREVAIQRSKNGESGIEALFQRLYMVKSPIFEYHFSGFTENSLENFPSNHLFHTIKSPILQPKTGFSAKQNANFDKTQQTKANVKIHKSLIYNTLQKQPHFGLLFGQHPCCF